MSGIQGHLLFPGFPDSEQLRGYSFGQPLTDHRATGGFFPSKTEFLFYNQCMPLKRKKSGDFNRLILNFNLVSMSLLVIIFLGFFVYILKDKKKDFERSCEHATALAATQISHEIIRYKEQLAGISSRSMIRKKLYLHHRHKLALHTLIRYTQQKFVDGCKVNTDLMTAKRTTRSGKLVARFGTISLLKAFPGQLKLITSGSKWRILLKNRIILKKKHIGWDYALFRLPIPPQLSSSRFLSSTITAAMAKQGKDSPTSFSKKIRGTGLFLQTIPNPSFCSTILKSLALKLLLLGFLIIGTIYLFIRLTVIRQAVHLLISYREVNRELEAHRQNLLEQNRIKDQLFSIVSHDMKGPFSALAQASSVLRENASHFSPDELNSFLNEISLTSRRAYDLMLNLLNWAAAQIGGKQAEEKVLVERLCRSTVGEMDTYFIMKQLRISISVADGLVMTAPEITVRIILRNLLSNAVKFSPQGSEIRIDAEADDGYCRLDVRDSGSGMDDFTREHLFSLDRSKRHPGTRGESGSGIGLALCRDLADKSGGELLVTETSSSGTVFTLRYPLP